MNRLCSILGIQFPIVEGGLAYVGNGLLAAAVSEGGGLGQIGSGGRTVADFREQIEIALRNTERPLGVNIPLSEHHDSTDYFAVVEEYKSRLTAVSLSAGNPRPYISTLHELGLRVMTLASTPAQALKAQSAGADIVICEGAEAGGHNGPAELGTFVLIPAVKRVVSIPVVAAGGIADGQAAAAVRKLGADGVQMGTRFVATTECEAHDNYKQALLQGRAEDTIVMERSLHRVTRVLKSPYVERILKQEQETPGSIEHLLPMISGQRNHTAAVLGQLDNGWVNCGQSVEFIHDIVSAKKVVQDVAQDMERFLNA